MKTWLSRRSVQIDYVQRSPYRARRGRILKHDVTLSPLFGTRILFPCPWTLKFIVLQRLHSTSHILQSALVCQRLGSWQEGGVKFITSLAEYLPQKHGSPPDDAKKREESSEQGELAGCDTISALPYLPRIARCR